MYDGVLLGSKLLFDIGLPLNHGHVINSTHVLTPKLVSLSFAEGSFGSSVLIANVQGVGKGTTGLQLVN
jgi:hypothetical protein